MNNFYLYAKYFTLGIALLCWVGLAHGQTPVNTPDTPPAATAQMPDTSGANTANPETVNPETAKLGISHSDTSQAVAKPILSDAEIAIKIKAAETAQNAAYEALRAKYEADIAQIGGAIGAPDKVKSNADILAVGETMVDDGQSKPKFALTPEGMKAVGQRVLNKIIGWLTSPPFLAQIGAIALVWFLAPILTRALRKQVFLFRDPPEPDSKLRIARDYIYRSREFLRAAIQVLLLAIFALVLKNIQPLGQDWLVKLAQGLAVVFLLYRMIKTFIPNPLFQKLAIWIVIPLAVLMVFGYFDDFTDALKGTELLRMGDTPITLMTVVQLGIFGALFFKLGGIANDKGQKAIRSQESLDSSTREVVSKIFQIILFAIVFILVMGAAKIPLSGLVVIFSALSLGIGLGLQPVAANFVSGMIILFDRSVRVGDFVSMEDGREGFVEAINMRSTTIETTDGKDIMVPNMTFIESTYENWTHKDPRQRYEVYFTVAYDTDLDKLEDIVIPVFVNHPSVLNEPEEPDLELREFGDSGVNFAVEFWCSGIDDGPNKFTSDLNFAIWRALRANNIRMPLPQSEVRLLNK